MAVIPKALTRAQLATFLKDQELIIRFQRLFQSVGEDLPADIAEAADSAYSSSSDANEALSRTVDHRQQMEASLATLQARIDLLSDTLSILSEQRFKDAADNSHHNFSKRDYIDFSISVAAQIDRTGRCLWNSADGTLNVGLYNDVVLQMGQEIHYYAKNTLGGTIYNGQPVMYDGTVGASGRLEVTLAQSDPSIFADLFLGVATQDIASNDVGYITSFGLVRGIDTTGTPVGETWNDGDILYLSTTAGELTVTQPTAPDPQIRVAVVVYSHAIQGMLFVRPSLGNYLSGLHDVYISGIADGDLIAWDDTNQRWMNTSDPVLDTVSIRENLIFDGQTGEGILVDIDTPVYPWHDMLGEIRIRGVAATDPSYAVYTGGIRAYQFSLNDIVWNEYHIKHDYAPSTDLYIHVHWSHTSAAVTTGSVTWSFEITYAKGHDQAAFPATKTITVTQNGSTTQYQHMIAEVAFTAATADATHFDRDDIEIDGLILVKTELTANSLNAATDPFVHYIDIHYQSTCIGSKNKAPNFYNT